ncbi:MAG: hypothetical protein VW959_02705, partial [Aquiluna sp.]
MSFQEFLSQWSLAISVSAIILGAIVLRVIVRVATKRAVKTIVAGVNRVKEDERLDAVMAEQRL